MIELKTLPPVERLDLILSVFPYPAPEVPRNDNDYILWLLNHKNYTCSLDELREMLIHIESDKYIRSHIININGQKAGQIFFLTFGGELFKEKGGYYRFYQNQADETLREKRIGRYMANGALFAAVFSGLYLAWTVAIYGYEHHWFCSSSCH